MGEILQSRVRDPDLGFVTVTRAEVTSDLSSAKVFVAVYGDPEATKRALSALRRASRFVRKELAAELGMRYTPEIHFVLDRGYGEATAVLKTIHDLGSPPASGPEEPET